MAFINNLKSHSGKVRTIAVSSNLLASGSYDKSIKFWNVENGELLNTIADVYF
jgi:WD40 repeat protein